MNSISLDDAAGPDGSRLSRVRMVPLSTLHDHPRQHELFGDPSAAEFSDLVEDLRKNGQRDPIRILASGRIIMGHRRVRAFRFLGRTEIAAIVIEVRDDAEAEQLLIADNLHRRHLGRLALARVYVGYLDALAEDCDVAGGDLRDDIARRMGGISGRTLDRYRRVLKTPPEIQRAVEAREITMSMAGKVAALRQAEQHKLAEELAAGQPARLVVSRYLKGEQSIAIVELRKRYYGLQKFCKRYNREFKLNMKGIVGYGLDGDEAASVLLKAAALFQRLATLERGKPRIKEIRARVGMAGR
jgi:ParB/RepB/Spo0J family partition protein